MKHNLASLLSSASLLALGALPLQAEEIFDLGEIVISATAEPAPRNRTGASVDVLDSDTIKQSQTTRLSDTLDRLPGVSMDQNGPTGSTGQLTIRGSSERYIAVYIDGIKVNDPSVPSGQFFNFGTITNGNLSRVEVLKGSQSALYGGSAVAGVVNIFTLPEADTPEGFSQSAEFMLGSFNTTYASYGLVQKQDRLTLNFGISDFRSDGFSAAEENDGNREDDDVRETRLNFGAAYQLTDSVLIGINGFATDQAAQFDEFASAPVDGTPDEEGTRDSKGLRLYSVIDGDVWDQNIALTYFRIDRAQVSPTVGAETAANFGSPFKSDFEAERVRFEYAATTQLSDAVQLTLGGDFQRETAEYSNLTTGSEDVDTWGLFAEAVYAARADLDFIGTLRHDDHSSFGGETTGRLAFAWRSSDQLTFRGAVATGYRAPTIDELFGDYGAFFFGNPDLTPETSTSVEIGADYAYASGALVSATGFYTEIDDLITYEFPTLENVPGKSKRQGIELSGVLPLNDRLELFGSYTFTKAENALGEQLRRVPDQDITLGFATDLTASLGAQVVLNHVAGRADDGGSKMSDYTVVNASLTYALSDTTDAYLRLDNVFNEQYQTASGYGTPDRSIFVGIRASF